MTDKELKKLKRRELLEILFRQAQEIETLQEDKASLREKLKEQGITVEEESLNEEEVTSEQLRGELDHISYRSRYWKTLRNTVFMLITVFAAAALVVIFLFPVLRIYGSSMSPTLEAGDLVISVKTNSFETGDLVAFYLTSNRILVKRVIATAGQWVDIDEDGNVYVDGELLDEPYVDELTLGECNIELPYQVPDNQYFVMGDKRATSIDSRNTSVGCVDADQIAGKIVFRVWPLSSFGKVG